MIKYIKKSLALSTLITRQMATDDLHRLESLKDRLKGQFGVPVGVHMTGIPLGKVRISRSFLPKLTR
ncbi:hypothetical protein DN595_15980 [Enterobacter cloacae]|uniref:Uncharacterized protein n=1 Tax=Enterobacter cloacae TaxID=550 RepID=A0AB37VFJ4_ENTCL|nr:hypothetical protein DN595_15980 [Enterobacter cloacae]